MSNGRCDVFPCDAYAFGPWNSVQIILLQSFLLLAGHQLNLERAIRSHVLCYGRLSEACFRGGGGRYHVQSYDVLSDKSEALSGGYILNDESSQEKNAINFNPYI